MPTAAEIVNAYLDAFTAGEFEKASELVAAEFAFHGPFIQTATREAFFAGAAPLAKIARGHRLLRQWDEGDEVSSFYEFRLETPAGAGSVLMSEWHRVCDGRLSSARLVFDTGEFRTVVPAPPTAGQ